MAKILVTGAAGFIGMQVAQRLLAEGHEVVGLDNFNDYYDVKLKRDRAGMLAGEPRFRMVELNLADEAAVLELFAAERFDKVCNLAAQAGVRYSLEHPFAYQQANLQGFLAILEGCRHHGVERLVYASSSSVYGGNRKLPFSEDDHVDGPISLYAATKKANELMAHAYTHLYGFQSVGLRFFTVYGPWGRPDMAMWLFAKAMLSGQPINVFNRGDMQRDFTYIDDIVSGVVASLLRDHLAPYEIFNLGNNEPEELMQVIELLGQALGVEPRMNLLPMQPGDVKATYADITQAKEKLGFAPTTPIRIGIPRFIDWYRAYHNL